MTRSSTVGAVAVFDVELPPGVSFIRSLGRLGVPVHAYSNTPRAAGRFSKYTTAFRSCPKAFEVDEFIAWLINEYEQGEFEYIAPTSDFISFVVAEVDERLGTDLAGGVGGKRAGEAVRDCLFKNRFSEALDTVGFPSPPWAAPTSVEDARRAARELGYPVVLKPRSHVGIGVSRGVIARSDEDVARWFAPYPITPNQRAALRHDPDLAYPIVQKMIERDDLDCVSITGYLDRDGTVLAANTSRKTDQWGTGLSIGTGFEVCDRPIFFDEAVDAVRRILGSGVFDFEVLFDRTTGEMWGIDLNPRGFGQIALDVQRGHDLPAYWYGAASGTTVDVATPPTRRPAQWLMGVPYYAGTIVRTLRGPDRLSHVQSALTALARPTAGSMHSWRDPRPGIALGLKILRHPGGLVRPFLRE